jgi:hypothetical protein
VRTRLVPECDAKLIFTMRRPDGQEVVERMWVQITGYTETGYKGVLNNEPQTDGVPLSLGDRVEFTPDHVIDALPPERARTTPSCARRPSCRTRGPASTSTSRSMTLRTSTRPLSPKA